MRENRTYGSEGGESVHPDFPTPIVSISALVNVSVFRLLAFPLAHDAIGVSCFDPPAPRNGAISSQIEVGVSGPNAS